MSTVFAQIIAGQLPCEKVFENERMIAFKDIAPVAPVHVLIVPKVAYRDLQSVPSEDLPVIAECLFVAQKLAQEFGIEKGYRFLTNNGSDAGQCVFHLHFHLIGGRKLGHLG